MRSENWLSTAVAEKIYGSSSFLVRLVAIIDLSEQNSGVSAPDKIDRFGKVAFN